MAKESEPYRLSNYSLSDLLNLVNASRAEKVLLEVGYTPALFVKGKRIEIEGPDVVSEVMEELVRSVAHTRQFRLLRENGTVNIIQTIDNSRFLVRVVDAFSVFRLDLIPMRNT
jgi:Tfp pilus assembly ATPase PilU